MSNSPPVTPAESRPGPVPLDVPGLISRANSEQQTGLEPKVIIGQALAFLHPDKPVFELCFIGPREKNSNLWQGWAGSPKTIVAGWYRDKNSAAMIASQARAAGVYTTLNPCHDALLSRAHERLIAGVDRTADQHITRLCNLLFDLDPIRPSGISSTDQEHEAALELTWIIREKLISEGWPEPLFADSGNGGHLVFPLDLENTPKNVVLLKSVLAALARRYADDLTRLKLDLDQVVFNPARLVKLYGTWARKGENTKDRPHRLARILSLPQTRQPVPVDLLERLVADSPETDNSNGRARTGYTDVDSGARNHGPIFDLAGYLQHYNVDVVKVKSVGGSTLHCLKECVFDPSHTDNEAAIGQTADGKLFYQCFHSSCKGRLWHDARELISGEDNLGAFVPGYNPGGQGAGTAAAGPEPEPERDEAAWPVMAPEAFYGLAGDFVRLVEPHTEADPVALLLQFLVGVGNQFDKWAYARVEADTHGCNLFAVGSGETAKGRKGTSWGQVKAPLIAVDPDWKGRVKSGLSSGEGLIFQVRDPIMKREAKKVKGQTVYEDVVVDTGEPDKRLLVVEPEFANVLRQLEREGNILSGVIRDSWDTGDLSTLTKNNPNKATGAHVSIIGHITKSELRRYLTRTEAGNGFGNRFLWFCVKRSKVLPEGGRLYEVDFAPFLKKLKEVVAFAAGAGEVTRDPEARALWAQVYPELSEGKPGMLGALTSRAEAQVLRLSMIYALLDGEKVVRQPHLMAALAVWDYCETSVRYIFGQALGDPVADGILEALKAARDGLTRTEISNLFGRHQKADRIQQAIGELLRRGLIVIEVMSTGGRPVEKLKYNRDAKKAKNAN